MTDISTPTETTTTVAVETTVPADTTTTTLPVDTTSTTVAPETTTTTIPVEPVDTVVGRSPAPAPILPEGRCWVPYDRMNEFPLQNHVLCSELEQTTVTVAQSTVAPRALPSTGSELEMAGYGSVLLLVGVLLCRLTRRPSIERR